MEIFGNTIGGGKKKADIRAMYMLSPTGNEKFDHVDNPDQQPGGLWRIMNAIKENGPACSIDEIAEFARMDSYRVSRTIEQNPALFTKANTAGSGA